MNTPFLYKKCTTCGEWKIANNYNFGKEKRGKFGLKARCKVCDKEYYKEYYKEYVENNKEKLREYHKEYKENNKEHIKEYNKEYYKENKEKVREHNKEYYENNKEKLIECHKEYRKNNKEYFKEYNKKYYSSVRGKIINFNNRTKRRVLMDKQGKGITPEQWREMMTFFNWKCAYSGETLGVKTRTVDHIAPLAQGGVHEIWNLTPMLFSYNSSKNSRLSVMNWYKEQEYFSEERLAKIIEWQQYAYDKWATEYDDPLILITDLYTGDDDIWLEK